MATRAARRLVGAGERVLRLAVIETGRGGGPLRFFMAFGAVGREGASMNVVLAMASDAIRRRVAALLIGSVAFRTGDRLVATAKGIVGMGMIEGGATHSKDIGITSLVVRVTAPALAGGRE